MLALLILKKKSSHGSTSLGKDVKSVDKRTQRINAEPEHEHIHDTQNGEFPLDAKTFSQPKACRDLEKSSKGALVKDEKANHTKELESSIGEKYNSDDKSSMYDKKGIIKENKGPDRIPKHVSDTREPHSRCFRGKNYKDRSRQMTKSPTSHSSRRS
jgi:beta-arabinofuranosyltransferase